MEFGSPREGCCGLPTAPLALPNKLNPADRRATLQPSFRYWIIEFSRLFVRLTRNLLETDTLKRIGLS